MQLISLCLIAILFATTVANAAEQTMTLIYRDSDNNVFTMEGSYGKCIPLVRPGGLHMGEASYPVKTECVHYLDAQCTERAPHPTAIHLPGYNKLPSNSGSGICHPV